MVGGRSKYTEIVGVVELVDRFVAVTCPHHYWKLGRGLRFIFSKHLCSDIIEK